MPEQQIANTPYPVIDTDPTFSRVVRSFRLSDYAAWGASIAAFPGGLMFLERLNPMNTAKSMTPALRVATLLGFCGGFLLAYQRTSLRYWGWTENEREATQYRKDMEQLAREGKSEHDGAMLSEHMQTMAAGNSQYSALRFDALPWFNFSKHKYHGQNGEHYR
ncbi:NADH-ubiquinone oxidoreductase complex I, 21 kDa subunit-domain-containing protein [Thamnocephalis sphaerospora]|uniref:NADH-ubiquinone oxidoreductase complex I, 21 kDa subunit-domain-containing protein n=1 Tax=Thamnocephalis sphaerospora TaxID=78915 RepID=A0A4P9XNH0_9FUNG|nr:NADH-ubiquinone oxidoreductase complex I, 21 kDa subunit-domain-containing protein [Thamnocephalis sphaerospora]|eukprot:RKP07498.1 NADH-ubiquinone oxidoreductase complex I, 21 kDa subunit-domain-containing protein [Thamnocephalis sphaerospora]